MLLCRQPRRRLYDHPNQLVSPPGPLEPRESFSTEPEDCAGLDSGRDPQSARPVEGRHVHLRPQRRLGKGNRQLVDDVVPFADEAFVGANVHRHVEVAGRGSRIPPEAPAGHVLGECPVPPFRPPRGPPSNLTRPSRRAPGRGAAPARPPAVPGFPPKTCWNMAPPSPPLRPKNDSNRSRPKMSSTSPAWVNRDQSKPSPPQTCCLRPSAPNWS